MKRIFDIIFSIFLSFILIIPILIISIIIKSDSSGPVIHWSKRFGQNDKLFFMPKFRTMKKNTPQIATHLFKDVDRWITPFGSFLRKSSLDELPQLWSIIIGEMSFVGPRPALYNQNDLREIRNKHNIQKLKPGITGLAQIEGRDKLSIEDKVLLDKKYMFNQSLIFDMKIIYRTFFKILEGKNIKH